MALALLRITARAYCYQAEVTDISGAKYFPAVKEAISKARESINVVMFTMESSSAREDSKPNQLIGALIEAKARGVDVEVILDKNIDFTRFVALEAKVKSIGAYKRLKDAGIKVYYDEPARYTHAKAVILDKKIVILGSANWTASAFDNNIETDVLIDCEKLAEEILGYLKTIKIDGEGGEYIEENGLVIPIGWEFLQNPKLAPAMVKDQAGRAFDVYLYLLWKYESKEGREAQGKLTLFYDDVARYLGIYDGWTNEAYRRQIIKVFRSLEQKYKLIKFEPRYAKEATITLFGYDGSGTAYRIPQEEYFELPDDYFNFGWNRKLSLRAKLCYLINLVYFDASDMKPYWSKSVPTITGEFGGVCQDVINKGMGELRRFKLLEVKYDELSGKPYEDRRPNTYKILKLYDPIIRELELKAIEAKYGKDAYKKAREYAVIVFEENNPQVIEDIILKAKEYGEGEIKRVFGEISRKNIDNPKRTYLYAVRIMGRVSK